MIKLSYLFLLALCLTSTARAAPVNKTEVLEKINGYRRLHQAPDVTWSDAISTGVSQPWTDHLAATNTFEHNPDSLDYGENIAMSGPPDDVTTAVNNAIYMWYSENVNYDYDSPGFSMTTGHFTQLVWANTQRIGVGVTVSGSNAVYVVMNFDPPGNYLGDFEGNVLPPLPDEPSPLPEPSPEQSTSPEPSPLPEPSPFPEPEPSSSPQLDDIKDLVDSSAILSFNSILYGVAIVIGVLLI